MAMGGEGLSLDESLDLVNLTDTRRYYGQGLRERFSATTK